MILGVSKDLPATQKKFEAKFQLPFRLLSDPDAEMQKAWGVWGEKNMYGKKVKLSDHKGKRVVVFFYPKALTSG